MDLIQRNDIPLLDLPSRRQLNVARLAPSTTDIPLRWLNKLSIARELQDAADRSLDGSKKRSKLLNLAERIRSQAVKELGVS